MKLENRQSSRLKKIDRYVGVLLIAALATLRPLLRLIYSGRTKKLHGQILVSKFSALGDVVVMLPALFLLKSHFSDSKIVFLGGDSNRQIVEALPFISRFVRFSKSGFFSLLKEDFDLVIDFDQWIRASALATGLMKSPLVVGFRSPKQNRHFAFDSVLDFDSKIHSGENFWNLTGLALEKSSQRVTTSFLADAASAQNLWSAEILKKAATLPEMPSKYFVIHPGCGENGVYREWPLLSWQKLITTIKARDPHIHFFITGHGEYEKALANEIQKAGGISLAGRLSFQQLLHVLRGAGRVFSSNTGIMHLANFLNPHVVVLNGPTKMELWGPLWGGVNINSVLECAPCLTWGSDYGCSDPVCVKSISPQKVIEAISHA